MKLVPRKHETRLEFINRVIENPFVREDIISSRDRLRYAQQLYFEHITNKAVKKLNEGLRRYSKKLAKQNPESNV